MTHLGSLIPSFPFPRSVSSFISFYVSLSLPVFPYSLSLYCLSLSLSSSLSVPVRLSLLVFLFLSACVSRRLSLCLPFFLYHPVLLFLFPLLASCISYPLFLCLFLFLNPNFSLFFISMCHILSLHASTVLSPYLYLLLFAFSSSSFLYFLSLFLLGRKPPHSKKPKKWVHIRPDNLPKCVYRVDRLSSGPAFQIINYLMT